MGIDRRSFMGGVGAAAGLMAFSGGVFAAGPSGGAKLLVVMLRGGYDAANFLAPVGSDDYHAARPSIALAKSGAGAALAIDSDWGLHPACVDVHGLFGAKQALFVPFSGNPSAPRSHFEAQDLMEAGRSASSRSDYSSGWLGRAMEIMGSQRRGIGALSFTGNLAMTMKGRVSVPNISGDMSKKPDAHSDDLMKKLYKGSDLAGLADQGVETRERISREMSASGMEMESKEMNAASRGAPAAGKGLAGQFEKIAKIMRQDKLASVGFVDVGGWDTHVSQGAATGALAGKLGALSDALGAYAREMGPQWADTGVIVLSEFGRTFRENGNKGTDHGHGTVAWVLGGRVGGGRVAGAQERVSMSSLNENRDLKVLNDYRGVAAETLAKLYGLGAKDLDYILPGAPKLNLGLFS